MFVIAALRGFGVEQFAGDVGGIDAAGVFVLHLVQTAFATAIAQSLPLATVERFNRLFPKSRR